MPPPRFPPGVVGRDPRDVAQVVARLAGPGVDLRIGAIASRPGEASRYVCAIDKVKRLTGWEPRVALEEGLGRTLQWWRERAAR